MSFSGGYNQYQMPSPASTGGCDGGGGHGHSHDGGHGHSHQGKQWWIPSMWSWNYLLLLLTMIGSQLAHFMIMVTAKILYNIHLVKLLQDLMWIASIVRFLVLETKFPPLVKKQHRYFPNLIVWTEKCIKVIILSQNFKALVQACAMCMTEWFKIKRAKSMSVTWKLWLWQTRLWWLKFRKTRVLW